jgi:hypothetical protein
MKKVVLLIAIAFTGLTANAQFSNYKYDGRIKNGNFHLEPALIVWTKVSDTIPDFDAFKNNPDILRDDISEYSGLIKLSSLKYPVSARFSIFEISEVSGFPKKLYRIDVTNISAINNEELIPIEFILLTKRNRFKKNISKQYDILFSDFFYPKKKLD